MKIIIKFILITLPFQSLAYTTDEDYDSIVSRLSSSRTDLQTTSSLDSVMFHMGVGYSTSVFKVRTETDSSTQAHQGLGLAFGIDLLSPNWNAEVGFQNLGEVRNGPLFTRLKEFDIRVLYKNSITDFWGFRVGAGLAGRYLDIYETGKPKSDFATPSSIFFGGLEAKILKQISIVSELNYKSPIVSNSPESGAIDFTIRLDGHL